MLTSLVFHSTAASWTNTDIINTFQNRPCLQGHDRVRTVQMQSKFPASDQCRTASDDQWHAGRNSAWREDHSVPSHPNCT